MVQTSRKVALGGILAGLCVAFLYLASYLPTSRLFLYGVSSVFCSIIIIEIGHKWSWAFYMATSMLAFFIIPNKVDIVPYLIFFGFYGILKYYIEAIRNIPLQMSVKAACFAVSVAAGLILVKELFVVDVFSKLPLWALGIIALVVFFIYDYAYTRFIVYYEHSLRKRIR